MGKANAVYYGCGFFYITAYLSGAVAPVVFWATTRESQCAIACPTLSSWLQCVGFVMCFSVVAILLAPESSPISRLTEGILFLMHLSWVSFGTVLLLGGFIPPICVGSRLHQFALFYLIFVYVLILSSALIACCLNSLLSTLGRFRQPSQSTVLGSPAPANASTASCSSSASPHATFETVPFLAQQQQQQQQSQREQEEEEETEGWRTAGGGRGMTQYSSYSSLATTRKFHPQRQKMEDMHDEDDGEVEW